MYVANASGRGKCVRCQKTIAKGEKQLVINENVNGFHSSIRICNTDAVKEITTILKELKGEKQ